jgi:hypothetical protein
MNGESKKFTLNSNDIESWGTTALIFLAPLLLIYFSFVEQGLDNGFQVKDLVPNEFVWGSIVSYALAELTALLKKFVSGTK